MTQSPTAPRSKKRSREELESIRDSFEVGQVVEVVRNTWDRPNTIGKTGRIVEDKDQYTPCVRVRFDNGMSSTFSPDDVEGVTEAMCSENWHIFDDLLKEGEVCKCGKKKTTKVLGKLEDV